MASISPKSGALNSSHLVEVDSQFDARCSESFSPFYNNTDYQDGNGKWIAFPGLGATFLTYSRNGAGVSYPAPPGIQQSIMDYVMDNPTTLIDHSHDFIVGATFHDKGVLNPVDNWWLSGIVSLAKSSDPTKLWIFTIRLTNPGPVLEWKLEFIHPAGPGYNSGWVAIPASSLAWSGISAASRVFDMRLAWSKRVHDASADGVSLFLNGIFLTKISSPNVDLDGLGADCYTELVYIHESHTAPPVPVTFTTVVKNFGLWSYPLYGNGTSFDYALAISNETDRAVLMQSNFEQNFGGWPIAAAIVVNHGLIFVLHNYNRSGHQPLNVVIPMTNALEPVEFEYYMKNRRHNNPFVNKAPILMIDGSIIIDDTYLSSGAVYDASGDETGIHPELNTEDSPSNQLPSTELVLRNTGVWNTMNDGQGDSDKVDNSGRWKLDTNRNKAESGGSKMINEGAYAGFVGEYSEMGSNEGDGAGNFGWPVSCNRAPSDPLEFYDDGVAPGIVMESGLRYFRFASLNSEGTDRHKALFAALLDHLNGS